MEKPPTAAGPQASEPTLGSWIFSRGALGFRDFRVRHHGDLARIELSPQDLPRALELRNQILTAVQAAGYRFATLDLAGQQL